MIAQEDQSISDSSHFTYRKVSNNNLCQGDILEKTKDLVVLLELVHPHYVKDDYTHLMVITQTCDLVRRINGGKDCKSRYITLVPIRPLDLVISRIKEENQSSDLEKKANVLSDKYKSRLMDQIKGLFNNNHKDFFYLHGDASFNFPINGCAFLQLPISIRSKEHYQKCMTARILSLEDNFRAKLGHNIGEIYSRVGTQDWTPDFRSVAQFNQIVEMETRSITWIEHERLTEAKKRLVNLINTSSDEKILRESIENLVIENNSEKLARKLIEILKEITEINPEQELQFKNSIVSNTVVKQLLK